MPTEAGSKAKNRAGGGAEFTVWLPLEGDPPDRGERARGESDSANLMTDSPAEPRPIVLVIEDEAPIRKFLRTGLESQGFQLVEAVTGKEGLAQAATRAPDVVLLDLGLPDIDGFEVVKRLREWSTVPVLVLSARGQERDKVQALDAGADDYVTKPFSMGELLARMRVALRHANAAHGR